MLFRPKHGVQGGRGGQGGLVRNKNLAKFFGRLNFVLLSPIVRDTLTLP